MKNIIYKRSNSITKNELLDVFEFGKINMSPYMDYYTYQEACRLNRFTYAAHTEIVIKDRAVLNVLFSPNGLMVYVGKEYIVSLDILS